jgi:hypothetical protein
MKGFLISKELKSLMWDGIKETPTILLDSNKKQ